MHPSTAACRPQPRCCTGRGLRVKLLLLLLLAPHHPALTASQGCVTETYFYLLCIQNCAASPLLQGNLDAARCFFKLSCATGTPQGCPHTAQAQLYHGQTSYAGWSQSPGLPASLAGPLPWQRLYFSPVETSSRAVHQTKAGSDHAEDPCLQAVC